MDRNTYSGTGQHAITSNYTNTHLQRTVNTNWNQNGQNAQDLNQRPFTNHPTDRQQSTTTQGPYPSKDNAPTRHGRHLPPDQHMGNSSLQYQANQTLENTIHPVENPQVEASEKNLNYGRKFPDMPEQLYSMRMVHEISQPPLLQPPFSQPPPNIAHPRLHMGNPDAPGHLPTAFRQQQPMRPSLTPQKQPMGLSLTQPEHPMRATLSRPEIKPFRSNSIAHMKPPVTDNVPSQFLQPRPPEPQQISFRHPYSVPPPSRPPPPPQFGGSDRHPYHPEPRMYHVRQSGFGLPAKPPFHGHHMPLLQPSLSSVNQNTPPPTYLPQTPVIYPEPAQVTIGAQGGSAVIPSVKSEQERLDEEWVSNWVHKLGVKKSSKQPRCEMKVGLLEYEQMIQKLISAQDELQTCMAQIEALQQGDSDIDADATRKFLKNAKELKKQIADQSEMVNDEALVVSIQKQVQERQKKRERLKRRKQERYAEQQEVKKRRAELHVQIDQWRNSIYEKDRTAKEAKELKAHADTVMSEVRKKMLDAKRMQALVKKLRKLRHVRKEAALNKGHNVLDFFEDEFEGKTSNILQIMAERIEIYEPEENALKVLVETEQEEEKEKAREFAQKREADRRQREERRVMEQLFGKDVCLYEHDPMLPFTQYYKQAEDNMAALYHIRKEWDMFLVPPHVPGASPVPRGWVIPVEPSTDLWREQLISSATKQQKPQIKDTTKL